MKVTAEIHYGAELFTFLKNLESPTIKVVTVRGDAIETCAGVHLTTVKGGKAVVRRP